MRTGRKAQNDELSEKELREWARQVYEEAGIVGGLRHDYRIPANANRPRRPGIEDEAAIVEAAFTHGLELALEPDATEVQDVDGDPEE